MTEETMEERRQFDLVFKQHTEEEIARYEDLKRDIKALQDTVENLVNIWNQAKGALSIIKWLTAIFGCLGGLILFIKDHIK